VRRDFFYRNSQRESGVTSPATQRTAGRTRPCKEDRKSFSFPTTRDVASGPRRPGARCCCAAAGSTWRPARCRLSVLRGDRAPWRAGSFSGEACETAGQQGCHGHSADQAVFRACGATARLRVVRAM
jgi:hypothetical protein